VAPREQTLRQIVRLAGPDVLRLEDPADGWPGYGQVVSQGVPHPVALYVAPVGLSHRQRDHIERRFQNPAGGRHPIDDERPRRTMLLLGLWEADQRLEVRRPVLVAADPVRRIGKTTRFSVFARVEPLLEAARTGWAEDLSGGGELVTYFWPEHLGDRLVGLPRGVGTPLLPFGKPLDGPRQRPKRPATADPFPTDPDKVDRGTQAHHDIEDALRRHVEDHGIVPVEPQGAEPQFDLGWSVGTTSWIAEVKSITTANEERQLRYGLGQVLHYGTTLAHLNPRLVLVIERAPSNPEWSAVCASAGVALTWPAAFDLSLTTP
jgi:hypothetical protein